MKRTVRRMTALAGIGAALAAAAPVVAATAATLPVPVPSTNPVPVFSNPLQWLLPGTGQQPGSCGANQSLPPGIVNLGPTGPLGPLGPHGPRGGGNLPCGASVFNLGPSGPLGPNGPLGGGGLPAGL
jgi:hypothetical protein